MRLPPNRALNRTRRYVASCLAASVAARRLGWIRQAAQHGQARTYAHRDRP
jgi:hypothetical protein